MSLGGPGPARRGEPSTSRKPRHRNRENRRKGETVKSAILVAVVVAMAARARAAEDTSPPSIVHEPCEQYRKGGSFEVRARFVDDSPIFEPKVIYRSGGGAWKNARFEREPGRDFRAVIRAGDLKGALEYFLEAFDENGNGPARYGSPEAPVKVTPAVEPAECQQIIDVARPVSQPASSRPPAPAVAPAAAGVASGPPTATAPAAVDLRTAPPPPQRTCERADRPLYCSPWLWTAAGAVLVGGGVGGYLLLAGNDGATAPTQVTLRVSAPNPAGQ